MRLDEIKKGVVVWGSISQENLDSIQQEEENLFLIIPEIRPFLLGLKNNLPLVKACNIPYIYCTDNMLGVLFFKDKIKRVYLIYKECKGEEGLIGISGSLYVVMLAYLHKVQIKLLPENNKETNIEVKDKDASTINGNLLVDGKDKNYIILPEEELIKWEFLC